MAEFNSKGGEELELSVLMPCLNEARTVGMCVTKALTYLAYRNIKGEVVVADNRSTDGSQAIAASLGARVVPVPSRGYGTKGEPFQAWKEADPEVPCLKMHQSEKVVVPKT
jgi:glycosyltransferase involved in cell wall biosynthesis